MARPSQWLPVLLAAASSSPTNRVTADQQKGGMPRATKPRNQTATKPRGWRSLWEPNVSATCEGLNSTGGPPPLSIVIPHMGGQRRSNLGHLIAFLLSQPFMRHPSSEIVINHGCNLSWSERGSLDDLSRRLLAAGPGRSGQKAAFAQTRKTPSSAAAAARVRAAVTHLLGPRTELFAASRYFAAAEARNEVIVSMDDDIMPFASQADLVEALSCSVRRELLRGSPPALH